MSLKFSFLSFQAPAERSLLLFTASLQFNFLSLNARFGFSFFFTHSFFLRCDDRLTFSFLLFQTCLNFSFLRFEARLGLGFFFAHSLFFRCDDCFTLSFLRFEARLGLGFFFAHSLFLSRDQCLKGGFRFGFLSAHTFLFCRDLRSALGVLSFEACLGFSFFFAHTLLFCRDLRLSARFFCLETRLRGCLFSRGAHEFCFVPRRELRRATLRIYCLFSGVFGFLHDQLAFFFGANFLLYLLGKNCVLSVHCSLLAFS